MAPRAAGVARLLFALLFQALLDPSLSSDPDLTAWNRSKFVSKGVQYCYERLTRHNSCCLDKQLIHGVNLQIISRPGTHWFCSEKIPVVCQDASYGGAGPRGDDDLHMPRGSDCSTPRLLWIHGGSWLYASPKSEGYRSLGSKLAAKTGAIVLMIDYPLAPVGNYSTILSASLAAFEWLADHGPMGRLCDPLQPRPPLFIGGDSSGGGTAFSLLLQISKEPGRWPTPSGGVLYSPWTNLGCDTPSYYHNAFSNHTTDNYYSYVYYSTYTGDIIFKDGPGDATAAYRKVSIKYLGGDPEREPVDPAYLEMLRDPVASGFHAGSAELKGLPPMYWVVSGTELLAGDSILPGTRAASMGVDVTLDVHPGMWHVFPMYSEGCGGGEPIYQAMLALNRTADFVRTQASRVSHVAAAAGRLIGGSSAEECASAPSIAWAYDSTHFDGSERPWSEVKPMAGQPQCAAAAVLASSGPAEPRHSDIGGSMLFVVGAVCGALMGVVARDLFPLCWSGFREEHGPRGARDAQVLE